MGLPCQAPALDLDGTAYVASTLADGIPCGDEKPIISGDANSMTKIMSSYSPVIANLVDEEKNPHQSDKFDHVADQRCPCDVTE